MELVQGHRYISAIAQRHLGEPARSAERNGASRSIFLSRCRSQRRHLHFTPVRPERIKIMNKMDFTFSDTVAGYVTTTDWNTNSFGLKTSDDREYWVKLTDMTDKRVISNPG